MVWSRTITRWKTSLKTYEKRYGDVYEVLFLEILIRFGRFLYFQFVAATIVLCLILLLSAKSLDAANMSF